MPLPVNHPLREAVVQAFSRSIGASPEAAYIRAPFRGRVLKVGCVTQGTITTADAAIATHRRRDHGHGRRRRSRPAVQRAADRRA